MKHFYKYNFFLLASLSLILCGCNDKHSSAWTIPDKKINLLMREYNVQGVAIVIIQDGKVSSVKSYGVNKSAVFEAASLGKPIFAYGVLKLVEKGQLDLDIPLSHYLQNEDAANDPRLASITTRMILSHTSGLPNWRSNTKKLKIYFQPGRRFSYSGEGYFYLQKVIEKITKQSLEQYMQENVFVPLGMTHSSYIWQNAYHGTISFGHTLNGTSLKLSKMYTPNVAFTLYATALDYSKFIQAIMNHKGLREKTIHEMLSAQIKVSDSGPICIDKCSNQLSSTISWGLGFGLQKTQQGSAFWHWGDNPGFKNFFIGFQNGNAIVIFTNSDNGMKIIPEIIHQITGYNQPVFNWLNYTSK